MNRYEKHIAQEMGLTPQTISSEAWKRFLKYHRGEYAPAKPMKSLMEGWRTRSNDWGDSWVNYCVMENDGLSPEEVQERAYEEFWVGSCGHEWDCCGCVSSWHLRTHCVGNLVIVVHRMHRNV